MKGQREHIIMLTVKQRKRMEQKILGRKVRETGEPVSERA